VSARTLFDAAGLHIQASDNRRGIVIAVRVSFYEQKPGNREAARAAALAAGQAASDDLARSGSADPLIVHQQPDRHAIYGRFALFMLGVTSGFLLAVGTCLP
jgi:hypothetical protein